MSFQSQRMAHNQGMAYGGQALIEGVMMRGRYRVAVAVRNPKGEIEVYEDTLNPTIYRGPLSQIPFVRGLTMLWDALGIGMRALAFSAEVAAGVEKPSLSQPLSPAMMAVPMGISAGMVFLSPAIASGGLARLFGIRNNALATALEGMLRLGLVTGYVWLVGQTKEGQRLFAYHGAEHKTVNALEAGAPLTPESVKQFPLEHPRCGTAFLITVLGLSTILQVALGRPRLGWLLLMRIALIPIVAGIAYEFMRFAATHMDDPMVRAIVAPNLLMQKLTTREPDLEMIRVAIAAMERVLASEEAAQLGPEIPVPLHSSNGKTEPVAAPQPR